MLDEKKHPLPIIHPQSASFLQGEPTSVSAPPLLLKAGLWFIYLSMSYLRGVRIKG